jgi:serum/glucocorticoid-regulated kinase 2
VRLLKVSLKLILTTLLLAPYIPPIDPSNASDTQNFDDTFLDMDPVIDDGAENEQTDTDQERGTDTDRTDGEESNTTPSRSRSSSTHPPIEEEDTVDVFDGYSFKGRHSVIIDVEEEEEEEEESEEESEEDVVAGRHVVLDPEEAPVVTEDQEEEVEDLDEPKTPEARQSSLPQVAVKENEDQVPHLPSEGDALKEGLPEKPPTPEPKETKAMKPPAVPPKTPHLKASAPRTSRGRREKSGVPALDRYLSDTVDEDEEATEREDEDDDWDFVEAGDQEDRNGAKATSLFARGVVDRYRLAVFGKAATPSQQPISRSVSGVSDSTGTDTGDSPSPSEKRRRGRTPLTFRKHPRQFLRPKATPPSSYPSKSSSKPSTTQSVSTTLSAGSLISPSPTLGSTTLPPSLRSKESAGSVGRQSKSDQSGASDMHDTIKGSPPTGEEGEKHRPNKLKKYKAGTNKVLSLFASPRQS